MEYNRAIFQYKQCLQRQSHTYPPNNTNILLVSTRKSGYGETFRSTDGGENWDMVLQGPNLISMEFNTSNPNIIYGVTTGTSKFYRSNDNGIAGEKYDI